jgi:drug/metabolite transporter (DMT)-like permease
MTRTLAAHCLTARIALLLSLPPLLWAGNSVMGRLAVGSVPPMALNLARWGLAFVLLLPLGGHALRTLRDATTVRGRWAYLARLGLLGMGCYNAFQYLALHTSTALNATLIAASGPVWMMAVGALGYAQRPTRRELLGAALSLTGVALVIARGDPGALLRLHFVPGDLLMVLATVTWAMYSWQLVRPAATVLLPPSGRPWDAVRADWGWAGFLQVQAGFGVLWSALSAGAEAVVADGHWHWSPWLPLVLLYLAVGPSLVAYRCWGLGVATVGPTVAAFFANLTPVFAALLSAALLGEMPQPYHAAAFALIVAGIAVSSRR